MSVIAHNIIAIILICVSKGRGRARGPVVPCVVGCPSPPRPCGCSTNHASPTIHASHQNTLQVGNQEAQVVQPESEQTKPRHTMKPPKPQGESTTLQFAGPHIFRSAISPHLILWPKTPKTRPLSQGSRGRRCLRISGPRGAEVDGGVPGLVGSFGLRFTFLGVGGSMV